MKKKLLIATLFCAANLSAELVYDVDIMKDIEEKNAHLEADILINLNKLIDKTVNKKDVETFSKIINKFKTEQAVFGKLSPETKKKYLELLSSKIKEERTILATPLSAGEKAKAAALGLTCAVSSALPIACCYSIITSSSAVLDNNIALVFLALLSPLYCGPLAIYTGIKANNIAKRNDNRENLKKFDQMYKLLAVHE